MLSDVPLMAYLGWNWIPFPNGLLIACFWFYRLLQLTRSSSSRSSDRGARTCDLPARTSARSPLRAAGWPDTIPSISGEPWAGLAPNSLPSHGIFWSCTPPPSRSFWREITCAGRLPARCTSQECGRAQESISCAASELVARPREDFLLWVASNLQMPS